MDNCFTKAQVVNCFLSGSQGSVLCTIKEIFLVLENDLPENIMRVDQVQPVFVSMLQLLKDAWYMAWHYAPGSGQVPHLFKNSKDVCQTDIPNAHWTFTREHTLALSMLYYIDIGELHYGDYGILYKLTDIKVRTNQMNIFMGLQLFFCDSIFQVQSQILFWDLFRRPKIIKRKGHV